MLFFFPLLDCCGCLFLLGGMKKLVIGKEDFNPMNLEAIVTDYPYRKNLPKEYVIKGYLLLLSEVADTNIFTKCSYHL